MRLVKPQGKPGFASRGIALGLVLVFWFLASAVARATNLQMAQISQQTAELKPPRRKRQSSNHSLSPSGLPQAAANAQAAASSAMSKAVGGKFRGAGAIGSQAPAAAHNCRPIKPSRKRKSIAKQRGGGAPTATAGPRQIAETHRNRAGTGDDTGREIDPVRL